MNDKDRIVRIYSELKNKIEATVVEQLTSLNSMSILYPIKKLSATKNLNTGGLDWHISGEFNGYDKSDNDYNIHDIFKLNKKLQYALNKHLNGITEFDTSTILSNYVWVSNNLSLTSISDNLLEELMVRYTNYDGSKLPVDDIPVDKLSSKVRTTSIIDAMSTLDVFRPYSEILDDLRAKIIGNDTLVPPLTIEQKKKFEEIKSVVIVDVLFWLDSPDVKPLLKSDESTRWISNLSLDTIYIILPNFKLILNRLNSIFSGCTRELLAEVFITARNLTYHKVSIIDCINVLDECIVSYVRKVKS